ncbi:hypothetical protein [Bdellovibrio sp. BCCA]|uniref:hypothetical protein n=1 Tax=Bdellovibrio sp. BCCA TaxID=3136281 RepID=UPI0030EFEDBF
MKKKIMSLFLLVAVLGPAAAMADSRSVNTEDLFDACTSEELKNGCKKTLYFGLGTINNIQLNRGERFIVDVQTRDCFNKLDIETNSWDRHRLYTGDMFIKSGVYTILNQSQDSCEVVLKVVGRR